MADREALRDLKEPRHGKPSTDPVVGVARHGGGIVGKEDATFPCSPFEYLRVVRTGESGVLGADDVHLGVATHCTAHDVVI